jgi:cysteine desulfurase / selenocysteine lyase
MHDVTPELIHDIATRLYNQLPGLPPLPGAEMPAGTPPIVAPAIPTTIPALPMPTASIPTPSIPAPSVPGWPPGAIPASLPSGVSPMLPTGFTESAISGLAFPGAAPASTDGLRAFVQRVQAPHQSFESGLCSAQQAQTPLQGLYAPKSIPAYGSRPLDIPSIRRDFPILNERVHGKPLVWFDNAATTQKPQSVIDALSSYYAHDNSNIHRGAHTLAARSTDAFEQARQKIQTFLGASSVKEIVLVRGTTEGINLITNTYGRKFLQPGDEIVLSTLEHHANIVPWQMIAKEKGAVIRVIPVNDRGEIMLEEYQSLLGPRTKVVALAQASNSLGTILPVEEMTQMAKRYGARVLIDGAQSVAHIPVNVQQLGCDFFVFSGHKIFGPMGIGAVYIKEELHEILPPWQGGGNMIRNVTFEETTYSEAPAKFEAERPASPIPSASGRHSITSIAWGCQTLPGTSTNCCSTQPSSSPVSTGCV